MSWSQSLPPGSAWAVSDCDFGHFGEFLSFLKLFLYIWLHLYIFVSKVWLWCEFNSPRWNWESRKVWVMHFQSHHGLSLNQITISSSWRPNGTRHLCIQRKSDGRRIQIPKEPTLAKMQINEVFRESSYFTVAKSGYIVNLGPIPSYHGHKKNGDPNN